MESIKTSKEFNVLLLRYWLLILAYRMVRRCLVAHKSSNSSRLITIHPSKETAATAQETAISRIITHKVRSRMEMEMYHFKL